jgi:ATP-dependent protease ClpP protease subunit
MAKTGGRAVDVRRDFYTMASVDGKDAEIQMYGEITTERPVDMRTGEPVEGQYIVLSEFLEDLKLLANAERLTIRMNSCGGNAYAAIPIHNRLRELKAVKTGIIDGVAMSGGSLILCACDKVIVNPSSLFMLHKCWCCVFGYYNADELRKVAAGNDATDKAQAAIYNRKSGLGEEEILRLMAEETYLTGGEALEKGFADELTADEPVEIAASADRHTLFVNGRARRLSYALNGLPDNIPTVKPGAAAAASVQTNTTQPAENGGTEGGKPMAKTLEELRKEEPELANQLMAEARAAASAEAADAAGAERARIMEIDAVAALFDDETVREAKYGDKPCTAQELAYRAAQKAAQAGTDFLRDLKADGAASGAQKVGAAPNGGEAGVPEAEKTPAEKLADAKAKVKNLLGKKEEKSNG